jgi:glycosyltransferase involved in cell wall biosynthesis
MKSLKKKLLFVMHLPPPVHGVSVISSLIKNSALINESAHCDYIDLSTASKISDLQKNRLLKYFLTVRILLKCVYKMAFNRYHKVYVTPFPYGFAFVKDSMVVLLSKMFRHQTILHLHSYGFRRAGLQSPLKRKYYEFVFKNCEVICLAERLTEDIEPFYRGGAHILPNGIPQVNFVNSYNAGIQPVSLLFLSNLIKGKGILVLLDAVEILKRKGLLFTLTIAGAESDITYAHIRNLLKEKGLEDRVKLKGELYGQDKYIEFRNAGIFVLPSDYDTFGLVLVEAMQFGVPCVSTNVGAIPQLLGEGRGVVINAIQPPELAAAIEELILSPEKRAEMSRRSFNYYEKYLKLEVFEDNLKKILTG